MVWCAIRYNWKSPLIFFQGTGKKGVQAIKYYTQVLEPVIILAFPGLLGYTGYTANFIEGNDSRLYVEDRSPVRETKKKLKIDRSKANACTTIS
jgi:hypothetical protein